VFCALKKIKKWFPKFIVKFFLKKNLNGTNENLLWHFHLLEIVLFSHNNMSLKIVDHFFSIVCLVLLFTQYCQANNWGFFLIYSLYETKQLKVLSLVELSLKSPCLHPIFGPPFSPPLSPLSVVSARVKTI